MIDSVKFTAHPKLTNPNMLAAWPGVSNVSMIVAGYLQRKLEFKPLGYIQPSEFFDPIGVVAHNSVIEAPQFPASDFFYLKNKNGQDLILFVGETQPATKSYELAKCVLDVAQKFQVGRIYTCAAAITRIHHTETPGVWGVGTTRTVAEELKRYNLLRRNNLQIAGLNGILLGVAKERRVEGVCLLGEVPMYATRIQNPMAALAILKVLCGILGIAIDLNELAQVAADARDKMKQAAAEAMGEYIDYFTEPIWEQGQEEDTGEDDEEEGGEEDDENQGWN